MTRQEKISYLLSNSEAGINREVFEPLSDEDLDNCIQEQKSWINKENT